MVDLAPIVKLQMAEIDRLQAENSRLQAELQTFIAWAGGDQDALQVLQRAYSNPTTTEANRLKAAGMALPFETAKPAQVVIQMEDWAAKTRRIRLAADAKLRAQWALEDQAKVIEHDPKEGSILGGDRAGEALDGDPAA